MSHRSKKYDRTASAAASSPRSAFDSSGTTRVEAVLLHSTPALTLRLLSNGRVGLPHFFRLLHSAGRVANVPQAGLRLILPDLPKYLPEVVAALGGEPVPNRPNFSHDRVHSHLRRPPSTRQACRSQEDRNPPAGKPPRSAAAQPRSRCDASSTSPGTGRRRRRAGSRRPARRRRRTGGGRDETGAKAGEAGTKQRRRPGEAGAKGAAGLGVNRTGYRTGPLSPSRRSTWFR